MGQDWGWQEGAGERGWEGGSCGEGAWVGGDGSEIRKTAE